MIYKKMHLCCIDKAQHMRTCGYWYLVRESAASHTAFRTREALIAWMDALKLKVDGDIPEAGAVANFDIIGQYEKAYTMDVEAFDAVQGKNVYELSNGQYTIGKITYDAGMATVHVLNPNAHRIVFDYLECAKLIDAGQYVIEPRKRAESNYKAFRLVDIPSGMGSVLPAAVSRDNYDGTLTVICLHDEYFPNWVLTVKTESCRPFSYKLDASMRKVIDGRLTCVM